jgi:hypothetical protein
VNEWLFNVPIRLVPRPFGKQKAVIFKILNEVYHVTTSNCAIRTYEIRLYI